MIQLYLGPMKSGKSTRLMEYFKRLSIANIPYVIFQPSINIRDGDKIQSRNGTSLSASPIDFNDKNYLVNMANAMNNVDFIGIDEIFMFPEFDSGSNSFVDLIRFFGREKNIIIASLDSDFRGNIFPIVNNLMKIPEIRIEKLTAICHYCKQEATRTQKYIKGQPANYNSSTEVSVEGVDKNVSYVPVCAGCHKVPGKPNLKIPFGKF